MLGSRTVPLVRRFPARAQQQPGGEPRRRPRGRRAPAALGGPQKAVPRHPACVAALRGGLAGAVVTLSLALSPAGAPALAAAAEPAQLYENEALEELRVEGLARDRAAKAALAEERAEVEAAALAVDAEARTFFAEERAAAEAAALAADAEARAQLSVQRETAEAAARQQALEQGSLCVTPFGVDVVGVSETVLAVGALSGGLAANARKREVEELNEKLRSINLKLREQARAGITYAPGLIYAPTGGASQAEGQGEGQAEAVEQPPAAADEADVPQQAADVTSAAPETSAIKASLRTGKTLLNQPGKLADSLLNFEKALLLAKGSGNKLQERRAVRGIAAVKRRQGQRKQAIKQLKRVLALSNEIENHAGDMDAVGTIADLYAELGDLETAADFYDQYIAVMNREPEVDV